MTRFTASNPCPVCGGFDPMPRGEGKRCYGFTSDDGEWAHCTREEHAGDAPFNDKTTAYVHRLQGGCKCGQVHNPNPQPVKHIGPKPRIVQTYDYPDRLGKLLFQAVRFENPKSFKQRRPDGGGGWIWNLNGTPRVLYRLPELIERADETVYLVEGEKDVDRLIDAGLLATTNPMGAGKWRDEYSETLRGRHVCIIPDNDEPGRNHADTVARSLHGGAASVRVLELPDLDLKGDLSDWLDAGGTVEDLRRLAREAPEWEPSATAASVEEPESTPAYDGPVPRLVKLADVHPEPIRWLWPGRIALGKVVMIAGNPGLGKSLLTVHLASCVSQGSPWPDDPDSAAPVGGVVLLTAEDDLADTVRPRLDAAGADVSRITALSAVTVMDRKGQPQERMFSLEQDLRALEIAIKDTLDCRLVIIDPITAYLGGADSHNNADIRGLLAPLADLASRYKIAIVCVTHLNKSTGGPAMYRTMGSLAFVAAARAVWAVVADKNDPSRRLMLPIKNNLGPDQSGLAFSVIESQTQGVPVLAWEPEPVEMSVEDAMAPDEPRAARTATDDAADLLMDLLADKPLSVQEVKAAVEDAGLTWTAARKAKVSLEIQSYRKSEGNEGEGEWHWRLPSTPTGGHLANLRENPEEGGLLAVSQDAPQSRGSPCQTHRKTHLATRIPQLRKVTPLRVRGGSPCQTYSKTSLTSGRGSTYDRRHFDPGSCRPRYQPRRRRRQAPGGRAGRRPRP